MEARFRRILARVPFPIRGLYPVNGSECPNDRLVGFWGTEVSSLQLSRSRPHQKNGDRFVEQRNPTLVRAHLAQVRPDTVEQCAALNALYGRIWVFFNLCHPVVLPEDVRRHWGLPTLGPCRYPVHSP